MNIDDEKKEAELLQVNRYQVEENAVFLNYEAETLTDQITHYQAINYHIRLSLTKNLSTIREALDSNHHLFYQLIHHQSKDHEDIQTELIKYLQCQIQLSELPTDFKELLLKPLINMIEGPYLEIKQNGCKLISELAHKLELDDKIEIIKMAVELGHHESEENKIVSLQLLAKLALDMPSTQKESIFKEQFINLYKNSSVRIKKQVIIESGHLTEHLSRQFVDEDVIEQFYLSQCKDSAWGIRKACVQIITQLLMKSQNKKELLTEILFTFLKDGNKFVRILAYKTIPQFISRYGSSKVPEKLVQSYLTLIDHEINNQVSRQYEIIIKISFYFPGVLYTLGQEKWPMLRKLFDRLLNFKNQEIKTPIASSLHQIAKIIGPEQSKQYLFVALDAILKQPSDSLKLIAINNISSFVELFEKATRENLIDVFLVLQKDPKKWRVRYSISHQLDYLSKIYEPQTIFKYILPISLKLCNDNVSEVRHEAARKIGDVVNNLKAEQSLYLMAIQSIKGYSLSQKYIQRQTFAIMIEFLYSTIQNENVSLMNEIMMLSTDKVDVVKIALAISLRRIIENNSGEKEKLNEVLQKLKESEEVAEYLQIEV